MHKATRLYLLLNMLNNDDVCVSGSSVGASQLLGMRRNKILLDETLFSGPLKEAGLGDFGWKRLTSLTSQ